MAGAPPHGAPGPPPQPPSLSQAYQDALLAGDAHEQPDYDPNVDPALRLRVVHSYAESIKAADRSEDRYQAKARRRHKHDHQFFTRVASKLSTRRSHRRAAKQHDHDPEPVPDLPPVGIIEGDPDADAPPQAGPEPDANKSEPPPGEKTEKRGKNKTPPARRRVHVNIPLPPGEVDKHGEPKVTYARNKVRTSKYTLVTFLPKFLYEQFRRVANIYFLVLIFLQMRVEFTAGASVPQISMLPLVAILAITAIKDGIEDSRRHVLDNTVNNEQVTRLGAGWRNVNQPHDARGRFRRMFGLTGPRSAVKPSKGVRKLRAAHDKDEPIALQKLSAAARSAEPREEEEDDKHYNAFAPDAGQSRMNLLEPPGMINTWSSTMAVGQTGHIADVIDPGVRATGTAVWEKTLWKKVEVGDILLLQEDEEVPADMVVLSTSDEDGQAFVETKNLDGETNLKPRRAVRATQGIRSEADLERARFVVDAEPPHPNLYAFNAVMEYTATHGSIDTSTPSSSGTDSMGKPAFSFDTPGKGSSEDKIAPISIDELLLRGCTIRNTRWVVGLVLFTGPDTKIMLNSGKTPSKRSKLEKETNFDVLVNFIILVLMCLVCGILGGIFSNKTDTSRTYYERNSLYGSTAVANGIILFFSTMIAFQNIVPISLYISIEIVKTIQAWFIYRDAEMYYAPLDYPCVPKTWNIADDLGQIEYVFSDKTGTLTQNVMEFKKCSIAGTAYGDGMTEAMIGSLRRQGKTVTEEDMEEQEAQMVRDKQTMLEVFSTACPNTYLQPEQMTIVSAPLARTLANQADVTDRENALRFFRALALCHTALVDKQGHKVEYKAESPDEAALVAAARDMGCVFLQRTHQSLEIEVQGRKETYVPLQVLAFNSTRKRMSTIIRETTGEKRIILLIKGADSVIYERLALDHDPEMKARTSKDLESFANAGLRTLCVAYKYLSDEEYKAWAEEHAAAAASLTDRDDKVDASASEIEQGLYLLGATALEDKLQQGAPDAIAQLRRAGIKIWILTGDKLQTAIEIGFSCNLLSTDMDIFIISSDSRAGARAQIEEACDKVAAAGRPILVGKTQRPSPANANLPSSPPKDGFAVVIDGETLKWALDEDTKELFLGLSTNCEAVVCCRVSPAQKAQVVRLVKQGRGSMTLAIGDGANDVAMIQEAHCGVGIAGREGSQAAMSADYAIGQFRFLVRLLLVHGHWSVVRIARMHCVFFFKNLIWTLVLAWFQIMVEFDGTYIVPYPFILLFNLVFTSLPSIILGALDQDVNAAALMAVPEIYTKGITGAYYTRRIFFEWVFDAVYQSAVCFFLPWAMINSFAVANASGHDMGGMYLFGMTVAGASITCANLVAAVISNYWTWLFWVIEVGSILSFYIFAAIYSAFNSFVFDDIAFWLYGSVFFWATLFLTVVASLLPRFVYQTWQACFHPDDGDIVREQWVAGDLKDRLGLTHRNERKAERRRRRMGTAPAGPINSLATDLENPPDPLGSLPHTRTRRSGDSLAEFVEGYRLGPAWTRVSMASGGLGLDGLQPSKMEDSDSAWDKTVPSTSAAWKPGDMSRSTLALTDDPNSSVIRVDDVPAAPPLPRTELGGDKEIRLIDAEPDEFERMGKNPYAYSQAPEDMFVSEQNRAAGNASVEFDPYAAAPTPTTPQSPGPRYHDRFKHDPDTAPPLPSPAPASTRSNPAPLAVGNLRPMTQLSPAPPAERDSLTSSIYTTESYTPGNPMRSSQRSGFSGTGSISTYAMGAVDAPLSPLPPALPEAWPNVTGNGNAPATSPASASAPGPPPSRSVSSQHASNPHVSVSFSTSPFEFDRDSYYQSHR